MATVIDSLIVTLGLDDSKFKGGQERADAGVASLKKGAEDTEKSFAKSGKQVAGFLALLGGTAAIKHFVTDLTESNAALGRLSLNLGMSTDAVSALSNAADAAGGSAGGMQGALDMLSKAQTSLQLTGQSGLVPYFSALGVAMSDVHGKARPVDDMMRDLVRSFEKMDRTKAHNMGVMMGFDEGSLQLMLKGTAAYDARIARAKELGVVTQHQADLAGQLKEAYTEFGQASATAGRELMESISPALEWIFKKLTQGVQFMRENKSLMTGFFSALGVGLAVVYTPAMLGAAAATWAAIAPLLAIVAPIAAVAAAVALLYDDFKTWQSGGDSLLPWAKWMPSINIALKGVKMLSDAVAYLFDMFIGKPLRRTLSLTIGDDNAPNAPSDNSSATGGVVPTAREVYNEFVKQGLSPMAAAGMTAQAKAESNFNPRSQGDYNPSLGIYEAQGMFQWHPDRQRDFKSFVGKSVADSTWQEQVAAAVNELKNKELDTGRKLQYVQSAEQAGWAATGFERPYDPKGNKRIERGMYASAYYGQFGAGDMARGAGASSNVANNNTSNSTSNTKIDAKIYTQSSDAAGIARELRQTFVGHANYGAA